MFWHPATLKRVRAQDQSLSNNWRILPACSTNVVTTCRVSNEYSDDRYNRKRKHNSTSPMFIRCMVLEIELFA